jgi:hypothetical protein
MVPTALLPLRRKACWGFYRPKNPTASARCEPTNLGTKGQHATTEAAKQTTWYCYQTNWDHNIQNIKYFDWLRQHNYMQPKTSRPAHHCLCSLFMQMAQKNIHHSYPISLRVAIGNVSISGSGSELSSSTVYMIVASGGTSGFRPCAPYANRGPTSKRATSPTSINGSARSKPWITYQSMKL